MTLVWLLAVVAALMALVVAAVARHLRAARSGRTRRRSTTALTALAGLGTAAAVALPLGAWFAWGEWDRRANYRLVEARVVAVAPVCAIEDSDPRGSRSRTGPMDCLVARSRLGLPAYRRARLVELRRITFDFPSPVDGRRRHARLDAEPRYRPVRAGDVVAVLAHRRQADRLQLPAP